MQFHSSLYIFFSLHSILHVAVANKQTSSIYAIIQRVPHPDLLDVRDRLGESAMHWAAITGQHEVLRRLLVSGATIDLRNRNGDTALHIACNLGDLDCVKALLKPISPSEVIEAQLHHYTPQIQGTNMIDFIHLMNYEGKFFLNFLASLSDSRQAPLIGLVAKPDEIWFTDLDFLFSILSVFNCILSFLPFQHRFFCFSTHSFGFFSLTLHKNISIQADNARESRMIYVRVFTYSCILTR